MKVIVLSSISFPRTNRSRSSGMYVPKLGTDTLRLTLLNVPAKLHGLRSNYIDFACLRNSITLDNQFAAFYLQFDSNR